MVISLRNEGGIFYAKSSLVGSCLKKLTEIADSTLPETSEMDFFSELKNLRVLLVDDDEWIRHSLGLYFEEEGCHILALETAEEGMEAVKGQEFDIVITDYRLSGMDGLEFLRLIRGICPKAKRILVTAYGNEDVITRARGIGIRDFIRKPFTSSALEASLKRMVHAPENSARPAPGEAIHG
jgi:DNA-binding NtrC family response regulator